MEYVIICLILYAVLVVLEVVPTFKKTDKKTLVFVIAVLAITLGFNIFVGVSEKTYSPTDLTEKIISSIFKV